MNNKLLNTGIQDYISNNLDTDIVSLLLKKPVFDAVSQKELAQQIESKKKCATKLPIWFKTPGIYYPKKLHIEQSSSEITARYKAEIISGKTLVDLTGGFGVDSCFFARKIPEVIYCEINLELAEIVAHNFEVLGVENIEIHPSDGLSFLKDSKREFDWLYLDPSRRNERKGKVFHLSDCSPNVTQHVDLLFSSAKNILIKTAPFLDISMALKDLKNVQELHIVAVENEVKELLWVLQKDYLGKIRTQTVNFAKGVRQTFDFMMDEERVVNNNISAPLSYLYEPNAAILKSGAFKTVGKRYGLKKLHQHTHLYTSESLREFPGRRFHIREQLPFDKRHTTFLKGIQANVAVRNFPNTVAEIKNRFKIKDGGALFLFFVKNSDQKLHILKCEKVH